VAGLREARGWTKVELADRLTISRQSIHPELPGRSREAALRLSVQHLGPARMRVPRELRFGFEADARATGLSRSGGSLRAQSWLSRVHSAAMNIASSLLGRPSGGPARHSVGHATV
jgi:transcriptional regulator with XRE-family HTH domain